MKNAALPRKRGTIPKRPKPPASQLLGFALAAIGSDHECLSDLVLLPTNGVLKALGHIRIVLEILLGVLAALADAHRIIAEPGARFFDQPGLDAKIEHFADLADAFAVHDIE